MNENKSADRSQTDSPCWNLEAVHQQAQEHTSLHSAPWRADDQFSGVGFRLCMESTHDNQTKKSPGHNLFGIPGSVSKSTTCNRRGKREWVGQVKNILYQPSGMKFEEKPIQFHQEVEQKNPATDYRESPVSQSSIRP